MKSNLKKRVITFRVMLIMALTAVAALVLAACYDNPVALDQRVDITPQEGYSMFVVPGQSTRLQAAVFSGGTEITEPRPNVEWAFEGAVPTGFSINSDGVVSVAPNTALETVATVRATVRAAGRNEGRVRGDAAVGYFEVRASNFGNRAHYTVITATGSRWSTPGNYYQAWSGSV
ncbi:MAG: hypothetical protein FWB72_06775, partial [Firmicutes bacterium]|nr:hypothetical protein [Bacillota bacterium]